MENKKIVSILIFSILLILISTASVKAGVLACNFHAYKDCIGNSVFWFDSCANSQDLIKNCSIYNQICKYGDCIVNYKSAPAPKPKPAPIPVITPTPSPVPAYVNNSNNTATLSVSFFTKADQNSVQWQKSASASSNSQIFFMFSVANGSATQADNVSASANIPSEIASLGNLQVDGAMVSGDIVSGINVGSIAPGTAKSITFEGRMQNILSSSTKQAVVTVNVSGISQTDSVLINFSKGQVASAAVSSAEVSSGFLGFLKRWYLWILVALVLIFLFVVVFRRLSSNE